MGAVRNANKILVGNLKACERSRLGLEDDITDDYK
jgi:hypothetical protein